MAFCVVVVVVQPAEHLLPCVPGTAAAAVLYQVRDDLEA